MAHLIYSRFAHSNNIISTPGSMSCIPMDAMMREISRASCGICEKRAAAAALLAPCAAVEPLMGAAMMSV